MSVTKTDSALLILGHGTTENPDSSAPTWEISDRNGQSGAFARVQCAFWKGEPSFRQIWPTIEEREVYVVPNVISEGHFTREVLLRELELEGHTTKRGSHVIHYCDPVGIRSRMTHLLIDRAKKMIGESVAPEDRSLIIEGHGTYLNKNSTEAEVIVDQVAYFDEDYQL